MPSAPSTIDTSEISTIRASKMLRFSAKKALKHSVELAKRLMMSSMVKALLSKTSIVKKICSPDEPSAGISWASMTSMTKPVQIMTATAY